MNIVVAVRCYNEQKNIERFMRGYDFADTIVVSDGGSTDDSVSILKQYSNVDLHHFEEQEDFDGELFNPDAPHMNFVLNKAKEHNPDWLIFDDLDCVPTKDLKNLARPLFEMIDSRHVQVDVFRLYLWGDKEFFPYMNRDFDSAYTSLWAWRPDKINIHADESIWHGTLKGLDKHPYRLDVPYCLLHKSWHPDTIDKKIERYNKVGIQMGHPFEFAGEPRRLPHWAHE